MKIAIQLKTTIALGLGPNLRIKVNKQSLHDVENLQTDPELELEFDPQDANQLVIEHWGKVPLHMAPGDDIACEVVGIKFDNIQLHRNLLYTAEFYPNWQYSEAPNIILDDCYIGYNGVWSLVFPRDPIGWTLDYIEKEMFDLATDYNHQEIGDDIGAQDLADFKKDFF